MKISLEWLSDFVAFTQTDPQKIAERVTEGMGEVDDLVIQGALLDHCCVGKILTLGKHPGADRLSLCTVQTNKGKKNIVCGGTNLRVGMRVAFAHTGATVRWHGTEMMTLEKTKIRGEESEGMICAAEELDLADQFPAATGHSIIDLGDGDEGVGKDLRTFLKLNDAVLHIDNHAITHRADLFSHKGVAREVVALGLAKWKKSGATNTHSSLKFTKKPISITFKNEIPKLVQRYAAVMIEIDSLGTTPDWMKMRLAAAGYRSVSLPVDITNYVSAELGMPLHSFDADDLKGTVHMRLSKKGEKITTLDHEERVLPDNAIVLSDDDGIFDLLGIMGGLRSSTKETTKRIYLHAASVDPASIRRAIIATAHRTEAATVYEKGIPRSSVEPGLLRAAELMVELIPGARIVSKLETQGDDGKSLALPLNLAKLDELLGVAVPEKEVTKIFTDLEFGVKKAAGKKGVLTISTPLHRNDVRGTHDLMEEVARMYGYNKITPTMPRGTLTPPPRDHRIKHLREALGAEGFSEILPLSLTGPATLSRFSLDVGQAIKVQNALGEELSLLHTSTLPALLEHLERNYLQAGQTLKTFHWGNVFHRKGAHPEEHLELTVLLADLQLRKGETPLMESAPLLLKDAFLSALKKIGYAVTVVQEKNAALPAHPGHSARLMLGEKDIGSLFDLHPSVAARLNIPKITNRQIAGVTIDLTALLSVKPALRIATSLPTFPAVSFDENIELKAGEALEALMAKMRSGEPLLESVEVVDLYKGVGHAKGESRVTLRCTYRAKDRTLELKEASDAHKKIFRHIGKPSAIETTV